MRISFKVNSAEAKHISQIVDRVMAMATNITPSLEPMEVSMDVTAAHANGCPLRLAELAAADDFDLIHDVLGIRRHIDRTTGKLGGCFVPRYAV